MNSKTPPETDPSDVDESSRESFPASDAPAFNPGIAGGPRRSAESAADKKRGATAAQLRDDIDKGRTGDKVPAPDPAAAPLGTDDEAAGAPPDPEELARLRERERR